MTKSIIQILLLFGMLFTFSCCSQPKEPNDNLNLTIAWKEDIYTWGHTIDYENKIMFCEITTDSGNDYTNDIRQISAFDLETLKFLWKTKDTGYNDVPPVFDDSNIYIMHDSLDKRKISVIDRKNGKIKKQTDVPGANTRTCLWTLYNDTLYWGGRDRHFMYAFSTTEENDTPRRIWGSEDVTSDIMGDIVPYNDRLYFVSSVYPYTDEPEPSYLISMKPDGSDIKKLELPADFLHTPENRTHFYEGKLYLNGMYFICVNPETMKIEWELKNSDGFFTAPGGFVIDNDRIYAPDNGGDEDAFFCINAKNGKVIWKEKIDTSFYGAILYTPIIYEGYIYQPAQDCIIMFNAENGKYVGRDERIRTGTLSMDVTKQYEDLMIFSGTCGKTHIIKMDLHTR